MGENEVIIEPNISNNRFINLSNAINCPCTVRLLKYLLGSRISELTLVNQFLFQSIIIRQSNTNLYNTLINFIEETNSHIDVLSNAILKFGGNLKFSNGQGTPWSARYLLYKTNVNDFLNYNIKLLEKVINNYKKAINCINNESLKQILNQIIEDKNNQIIIFKNIRIH